MYVSLSSAQPTQSAWRTCASAPPIALDEAHVWLTSVEIGTVEFIAASRLLGERERQRADRLTRIDDARRYVAAHAALRLILSLYTNLAPEALRFKIDAHGKPRLRDGRGWEFSLSHTGDKALIAVAARDPVGVDIERIESCADAERMARRFFSAEEWADWIASPDDVRLLHFWEQWSRKEAYLKALGVGLARPLQSFSILSNADRTDLHSLRLVDLVESEITRTWSVVGLDIDEHHVGALAHAGPLETIRTLALSPDALSL